MAKALINRARELAEDLKVHRMPSADHVVIALLIEPMQNRELLLFVRCVAFSVGGFFFFVYPCFGGGRGRKMVGKSVECGELLSYSFFLLCFTTGSLT